MDELSGKGVLRSWAVGFSTGMSCWYLVNRLFHHYIDILYEKLWLFVGHIVDYINTISHFVFKLRIIINYVSHFEVHSIPYWDVLLVLSKWIVSPLEK